MASLELGKLSSYDLLLSETTCDVYYARLTDSLYKTLEEYHYNKKEGQMQMTVNKQGRGGIIQVANQQKYNFKCSAISNKTGLDCLKQTRSNPGLTVIGTAHTRLIIQATEDVYQTTREKLILAEEKKNENQTVMIDFKNKRKLQTKKAGEVAAKTATPVPSNLLKPPQRTLPTFKSSPSITDSKSQLKVREKAIHILALRPHRKLELLSKLSDNGSKSKDSISKILGQVAFMKNNMYSLKPFLYGEVQVDTWPDYTESDRAAIKQQIRLQDNQTGNIMGEGTESSAAEPSLNVADDKTDNISSIRTDCTASNKTDNITNNRVDNITNNRADNRPENKPESRGEIKLPSRVAISNTDSRPDIRPDSNTDTRPYTRPDAKTDIKTDTRPDIRTDTRPDTRTDIRTDTRTDTKTDIKTVEKMDIKVDISRKRSSCDVESESHSTKKICRGKDVDGLEKTSLKAGGLELKGKGVEVNAKCRKAAEELKLPFMENVKKEICRIKLEYVKIVSDEQRSTYAAEFEKDYEDYVRLKNKEKEIGSQFETLKANYEKAEKKEVRSINRKARDLFKQYANDSSWCHDKEKLLKLEAKLSHIKFIFKQYEETVT